MEKAKTFNEVRFAAEVLYEAVETIRAEAEKDDTEVEPQILQVDHDDAVWRYDSIDEFLADYRKYQGGAYFSINNMDYELAVGIYARSVSVTVQAPTRASIETVFHVFEKNVDKCKLVPLPTENSGGREPVVFIGHGRNKIWRDLKDHLQDKHQIKVNAYESGARAGHSIRDVLEELVGTSLFAVLVLTGEDEQADGTIRARQNVIHEVGLFQGRLGFSRAIMLVEEGVDEFSNVFGIQQIRFSKGNIKETYGDVLATIRREFID